MTDAELSDYYREPMKPDAARLFVAVESARSFGKAMGKRRRRLVEKVTHDASQICVYVAAHHDMETLRNRAIRAGRALADEAQRKRLNVFAPLPSPNSGIPCVSLESINDRFALRLTEGLNSNLGTLYRLDVLGGRG